MNNKKYFNHYPEDWDNLGNEWKEIILKGTLSVSQAATLSAFSRQFIYKQIKEGKLICQEYDRQKIILWPRFIKWYSHFDELPVSPFGPSTFSLRKLMEYTGLGRSWVLFFVERNSVKSFFIGQLRRFDKEDVITAWKKECIYFKEWINFEEITDYLGLSKTELFTAVARHLIVMKQENSIILFKRDGVMNFINKKQ